MEKEFFRVNINKYDKTKDFVITRAASLNAPHDHSVMFCTKDHLAESGVLGEVKDCLVFWPEGEEFPDLPQHVFVHAKDPRQAYAMFFSDNNITYLPKPCEYKVVNNSFIAEGAKSGEGTVFLPGGYIDAEVVIGKDCYIGAGVKIMGRAKIGNNVVIRENSVIGADGLSTMRKPDGSPATIPQFGGVILEDGVQIGANTVIARAAIDDTVLHEGTKVDNSAFISHNVELGKYTFVVGETIMFGSSSTGECAYISGNSTIREGHHVGAHAMVGMGSNVVKNVPDGAVVKGNPAK